MALGNLGNAFVPEGDLQSAHMRYQQALALARNIGDKSLIAVWLRNDSEMLADLGDLTTAKQMATEALAMARASGDFSQVSNGLLSIGNIVRQQGDALHARQEYSEAMELRKRFGDPVRIAEVQLSLTELLLDESDWRSATSSLRDVLPRLREASLVDDELLAKAMLVEALLAQGDQTYAENEIRSGRILRQPNQKHSANFHDAAVRFSIAENRFLTSTQPAEAAAALQGLLKDANRRKYVGEQFRIRLALGEIELGSSNKASAHAHLTTLARDARAAGFILIASKAAHTEQGTQASLR